LLKINRENWRMLSQFTGQREYKYQIDNNIDIRYV
jgi:hypothetical protein